MGDIRLSTHFMLDEFVSNWRGGYLEEKNIGFGSVDHYLSNMRKLCEDILEPIRKHFMVPILIKSGFRYSLQHEDGTWEGLDYEIRSVRQKKTYDDRSQHTRGEAADIELVGVSDREVWDWIWHKCPNPFGQVIYEVSGRSVWVHVSIPGQRIPLLGGGPIYGEVLDAYQDAVGRWYYKKVDQVERW